MTSAREASHELFNAGASHIDLTQLIAQADDSGDLTEEAIVAILNVAKFRSVTQFGAVRTPDGHS